MVDRDVLAALRAKVAIIESSDGVPEGAEKAHEAVRATGVSGARVIPRPSASCAWAGFDGSGEGGELDEDAGFARCDGIPEQSEGDTGRPRGEKPSSSFTEESAFRRIERLCGVAEQCSAKLRARLLREGWGPDHVETAIARAQACLLLDDSRYAYILVRSRLVQRRGVPGIVAELKRLGYREDFALDLIDAQMEEEGCASEVERALAVLEAKPPRSKNLHDGAYRKLVGKGFSSDVSSEAATLFCERHR